MSAGTGDGRTPGVDRDLDHLAPRFKQAVLDALAECNNAANNLDAWVYEAHRSQALQALYYARGRTVIPPTSPVTNAPTIANSWHGYGLAVDVVHRKLFWNPPGSLEWFRKVAVIFKRHDCRWGGDWTKPDPPHFQWGACQPSPSSEAQSLLATRGEQAVWQAVGAA